MNEEKLCPNCLNSGEFYDGRQMKKCCTTKKGNLVIIDLDEMEEPEDYITDESLTELGDNPKIISNP